MAPRKAVAANKGDNKGAPKKRQAATGFKLPDPIEPGVILTDVLKKQWILGPSIGTGGFGEIYLAADTINKAATLDTSNFVVKIEPHSNGPLFTEFHCYARIAKSESIDVFKKEHRLKHLGMPQYIGHGSFDYKGQKYRFMIMERFGQDLQKILDQHNRSLSFKTVFRLGIQVLHILEYIHSKEYIHADIKASNLLVGHQKGTEHSVFLVDFGLACRYMSEGEHKEYKLDKRKAHDGTIEFTSRDAHIGAHSRRSDLEILSYNLTQWLCGRLPWEDNLTDCDYVATQKRGYMNNLDKFMETCFPDGKPSGLRELFDYVVNLAFDEKPDYEKCRQILREGLKTRGYKDEGKLEFLSATPKAASKSRNPLRRLPAAGKRTTPKRRSEEEENIWYVTTPAKHRRISPMLPCRQRNKRENLRTCPQELSVSSDLNDKPRFNIFKLECEEEMIEREIERMAERKRNMRGSRRGIIGKREGVGGNPTPQMLEILNKIRQKANSPSVCQKRHRHNCHCSAFRSSPSFDETPTVLTPEMENVMRLKSIRSHRSSDALNRSVSVPCMLPVSASPFDSEDSDDSLEDYFKPQKFVPIRSRRSTRSRSSSRATSRQRSCSRQSYSDPHDMAVLISSIYNSREMTNLLTYAPKHQLLAIASPKALAKREMRSCRKSTFHNYEEKIDID